MSPPHFRAERDVLGGSDPVGTIYPCDDTRNPPFGISSVGFSRVLVPSMSLRSYFLPLLENATLNPAGQGNRERSVGITGEWRGYTV